MFIFPKYFFWFSFKLWQVLVLDLNVLTKAESVEVILQYCTAYAVLRNKRAFVERVIGFYSQCTR